MERTHIYHLSSTIKVIAHNFEVLFDFALKPLLSSVDLAHTASRAGEISGAQVTGICASSCVIPLTIRNCFISSIIFCFLFSSVELPVFSDRIGSSPYFANAVASKPSSSSQPQVDPYCLVGTSRP